MMTVLHVAPVLTPVRWQLLPNPVIPTQSAMIAPSVVNVLVTVRLTQSSTDISCRSFLKGAPVAPFFIGSSGG
jgi:hypothetical protein